MRTRVKICGITRPADARAASEAGADAIGLVFYAASSRAVTIEAAVRIAAAVPPFVMRIGLFLDGDPVAIRQVLANVPLDGLQFHGQESSADCDGWQRPYIKAVPMGSGFDSEAYCACFPNACGFVFDSHTHGAAGGSGARFDWAHLPDTLDRPVILAGGLNEHNVAAAITQTRPYAVDVSSGVESQPGQKDGMRMCAFISEVQRVDSQ